MKNNVIRCDWCGKFISPDHVEYTGVTPDTHFTKEEIEHRCRTCSNPNPEQNEQGNED